MAINLTSQFHEHAALPLEYKMVVADITARDAIDATERYDGLQTYVVATAENWQLQGGITNPDWVLVSGGGFSSVSVTSPLSGDGTSGNPVTMDLPQYHIYNGDAGGAAQDSGVNFLWDETLLKLQVGDLADAVNKTKFLLNDDNQTIRLYTAELGGTGYIVGLNVDGNGQTASIGDVAGGGVIVSTDQTQEIASMGNSNALFETDGINLHTRGFIGGNTSLFLKGNITTLGIAAGQNIGTNSRSVYVGSSAGSNDTDGSYMAVAGHAAGANLNTGNSYVTLFGALADVLTDGVTSAIALGAYALTTDGHLVIGGDDGSGNGNITRLNFGNGIENAAPVQKTYIFPTGGDSTGGSGNDIAGSSIVIEGGASTGTAAGGSVQFATSNPQGSTSSSSNVPTTKAQLDGYVFSVQHGHGSGAFATVGGCKMDFDTDAGNSTTAETDLYSYTTIADSLATDGDKWEAEYGGIFVTAATETLRLRLYFGGTAILDSGAMTVTANSSWNIHALIIRVSSTVVRYTITLISGGVVVTTPVASGELTGLTLSASNVLKITGQAAGAGATTDHIVAKMGSVSWFPAALT